MRTCPLCNSWWLLKLVNHYCKNIVLLKMLGSVSTKRSGWQSSLPNAPSPPPLHHLGLSSLSSFQKQQSSFCRCPGLTHSMVAIQSSATRKCKSITHQQQRLLAHNVTLQTCFSHPSFRCWFISGTPPIKLKIGTANRWDTTTTNNQTTTWTNHYDWSIRKKERKREQ